MEWLNQLHTAAAHGMASEVAAILGKTDDVDAISDGRTALWRAVFARKHENADLLLAAGADPTRPMMSGWSPARLSLATDHPITTDEVLTPTEQAAIVERDRLVAALGRYPETGGFSIACVGGIDSDEAVRRLEAEVVAAEEVPDLTDWWDEPFGDDTEVAIGFTDVPGGCVVVQPWGRAASLPAVTRPLSTDTVVHALYDNPKSGSQGSVDRDGTTVDRDLVPGGWSAAGSTAEVFLAHLYAGRPVAYCCAFVALRPENAEAFTKPARWAILPDRIRWDL
ncbi:hypothetical protein ACFFQW_16810 [Umezawaea endophytica]|uniref:Ankyrin repeat domain-containing protein n=1 Tax=Umezawaea endophytica TaxID=1654476 RepID=A0A9X2VRW0_9PSEU|nr:ankyrin repeat domain-containing protein [Umezawaea endophytica]MCS7480413.1 ankyrin repeat domain-containing protein [Umezawaea endophytica]